MPLKITKDLIHALRFYPKHYSRLKLYPKFIQNIIRDIIHAFAMHLKIIHVLKMYPKSYPRS